jgi:MerR family transcriptional regulator, redox-sensitive transcriptional activator SoxR
VPEALLKIGELARRTGRRASAIRYYEQIGLLDEAMRVSGQRRYRPDSVRTLGVIGVAQRAGLSLDEIKPLLEAEPGDHAAIEALRSVALRKLPEVTAIIERATLVRRWLEAASRCECPSLDDCALFDEHAARLAEPSTGTAWGLDASPMEPGTTGQLSRRP